MRRLPAAILTVLCLSSPAVAQGLDASTRVSAVSGACHSYANGTAALHSNPAGMSQVFQYMVEGAYRYVNTPKDHLAGVSLTDSATNQVGALGLGYAYRSVHAGEETLDAHHAVVGGSTGFRGGMVDLFVGGLYHYYDIGGDVVHDATFGAMLVLGNMVRLGVTGADLFSPGESLNRRRLTAGVSFGREAFIVGFDTTFDMTDTEDVRNVYAVGAEYFLAGMLSLRGGYRFDQVVDAQGFSVGLGYIHRTLGLELAYVQNPADASDNLFQGSVLLFVQ